jgi:hypothetical protein
MHLLDRISDPALQALRVSPRRARCDVLALFMTRNSKLTPSIGSGVAAGGGCAAVLRLPVDVVTCLSTAGAPAALDQHPAGVHRQLDQCVTFRVASNHGASIIRLEPPG